MVLRRTQLLENEKYSELLSNCLKIQVIVQVGHADQETDSFQWIMTKFIGL